jgi:hypothetical protein
MAKKNTVTDKRLKDRRLLRLLNPVGFNQFFDEEIRYHHTLASAYEHLENLREKYFGVRAYSCYKSFQICRTRLLKKLREPGNDSNKVRHLRR